MFSIGMQHFGKVEAVGTVQVFGYSARRVDEHVSDMIYLNFAGPATAAASVWANLIERRALDFTDLAGKPHRLRHGGYPGLEGNEAPFKRFVTRIEHLAIDHCILLDRRFFEPSYDDETSLTFVFEGENMAEKVGHHVSQTVDIAVFPKWHAALAELGKREGLVTSLNNHGGQPIWEVNLDRSRWTTLTSAAVGKGDLVWPEHRATLSTENDVSKPIFSADDMISVYTRAQAMEDGVLIDACIGDLAEVTKQHYPCHVAMTASIWNIIERAVKNEKQLNDYKGVWHDVLWMSQKYAHQISPGVRRFKVKITGAGRQSLYAFKLVEGCGDNMEPVITIMLPEEE